MGRAAYHLALSCDICSGYRLKENMVLAIPDNEKGNSETSGKTKQNNNNKKDNKQYASLVSLYCLKKCELGRNQEFTDQTK